MVPLRGARGVRGGRRGGIAGSVYLAVCPSVCLSGGTSNLAAETRMTKSGWPSAWRWGCVTTVCSDRSYTLGTPAWP